MWGKKYGFDYTKGHEWELLENDDVCTRSQREHTECTHVHPHTDSLSGNVLAAHVPGKTRNVNYPAVLSKYGVHLRPGNPCTSVYIHCLVVGAPKLRALDERGRRKEKRVDW